MIPFVESDLLKGALFASIALVPLIYVTRRWKIPPPNPGAFVLWNTVAHSRFLPKESAHHFTYHTISLLVPLGALETHGLDLWGGWLFGYGSALNVCGVRPSAYLTASDDPRKTIRCKLDEVLAERGWDSTGVEEVWFATMPSFLAFEGINPLSVYYLYKTVPSICTSGTPKPKPIDRSLWLVVLEVHNTFGEKHIYVLETGDAEESRPSGSSFDHQWVFPRQFHVSPFNDRSGYYRCSIRSIQPPSHTAGSHPLPYVLIEILTDTEPRSRKLAASIRASSSSALSPGSLVRHLISAPVALLSTSARIVYQAARLHFQRGLDVFPRPEPVARLGEHEKALGRDSNPVQTPLSPVTGSIGWQNSSAIERWAADRTLLFLRSKVGPRNLPVVLISSHPAVPLYQSKSSAEDAREPPLTIWIRSPVFFTILLLAPSPSYALLLGLDAEKMISVSSREDFLAVFSPSSTTVRPTDPGLIHGTILKMAQWLRLRLVPPHISAKYPLPPSSRPTNPLDEAGSPVSLLLAVLVLFILHHLERVLSTLLGARFVPGLEPWNGWKRLWPEAEGRKPRDKGLGSARRRADS